MSETVHYNGVPLQFEERLDKGPAPTMLEELIACHAIARPDLYYGIHHDDGTMTLMPAYTETG